MKKALHEIAGSLRGAHEVGLLILLQLAVLFIIFNADEPIERVVLLCALLIVIQLISLFLIYRIFRRAQRVVDEQVNEAYLQKQLKMQEDHLFAIRQIENDFDEIRRKLEGQISHLDHAELHEADSILIRLLSFCKNLCQDNYSENKIIDAILYAKARRAQEQGIDVHVQAVLPKQLPIKDADLIAVCINLLENAIEECLRLPEGKRWLSFSAAVKKNFLILTVENAKRPQARVDFEHGGTSKEDAQMHGYGLKIIRRTAQRYEGFAEADNEEDRVCVNVGLMLKDEEKKMEKP